MQTVKRAFFYALYLAFVILASYSFGVIVANAAECGPRQLEAPVKDLKLDTKKILKKLLEQDAQPDIIKS